ncbi:hypothetical protein [Nodularia spumigena]|nr:hypothetical protein [Nodularia spumigena]MDB9322103.1 hypothetical protein [Nodularia spumigena CS-591/07A]MDB9366862.1 hypothetical protein [Nodularia spumigena CS-588/02A10]MDB9400637.1 hypothetical protein [Microcystis aeruginosa CS-567/02-A1]MDB9530450.1 hypothetical protein [Nodularia spumigena CS-1038]MDB9330060.1 hypothetical protein [Nodularia spumigena CS-591/04]
MKCNAPYKTGQTDKSALARSHSVIHTQKAMPPAGGYAIAL